MPIAPGTRFGPYEVVAALGAGGMGEVLTRSASAARANGATRRFARARDSKLNRDVAMKVLPETFAADAGRMARFEREAQLLAALNHPNIAAVYGIEQNALLMELVEGPTLEERLLAGAIPLDEAEAI